MFGIKLKSMANFPPLDAEVQIMHILMKGLYNRHSENLGEKLFGGSNWWEGIKITLNWLPLAK